MSHIKMDLSKFKHVSSDGKTTTLEHMKDGHKLTIVHSALSKPAQEQLKALSCSDKMAEGGSVKPEKEPKKEPKELKPYPPPKSNQPEVSRPDTGYGKVIRKATGGGVEDPTALDQAQAESKSLPDAEPLTPQEYRGGRDHPVKFAEPSPTPQLKASGGKVDHTCEGAKYCMHCGGGMPSRMKDGGKPHEEQEVEPHSLPDPDDMPASPDPQAAEQVGNPADNALAAANMAPAQVQGPTGVAANTPVVPEQGQPQAPAADVTAPQPQPTQQAVATPQSQPQDAPPPKGPDAPVTYEEHQQNALNDYQQEMSAFKDDLASGVIKPQTMGDLMHKKGLLGTVGGIFGLMLSGAGSGILHQPNALLGMMQKEIDNDVEAQAKNISNRQNLYKLNLEHQMQRAQIGQLQKQGLLTDAQAKNETAMAAQRAFEYTRMQGNYLAMEKLKNLVKNLPPTDPRRQQAEQTLGNLIGVVDLHNASIESVAASREAALKTLGGGQSADDESAFQKQQMALRMNPSTVHLADDREKKHVPGIPGMASKDVSDGDMEKFNAMNVLDNKVRDVLDFAKQHRGSINPQVLTRAAQKAEELTSFYNKSVDTLGMTQGRMGWLEKQIKTNPTSLIEQLLGNNQRLEEIRDSNLNRRNSMLKDKYGLKAPAQAQPQAQTQEREMVDPKSGKTVIVDSAGKPLRWK